MSDVLDGISKKAQPCLNAYAGGLFSTTSIPHGQWLISVSGMHHRMLVSPLIHCGCVSTTITAALRMFRLKPKTKIAY